MLKASLIAEIKNEYDELINMQEIIMGISAENSNEILDFLKESVFLKNEDKMESLMHTLFICYKIRSSERDEISNLIRDILPQINSFYSESDLKHLIKTFSDKNDDIQYKNFLKLFAKQTDNPKLSDIKIDPNSETKVKSTFSIIDIIMNDDIDRFQNFLSSNNKSVNEELPIEILGYSPTFLSLSMYFRSHKIATFLRMNNVTLKAYDRIFALAGGDYDLIHYVYDSSTEEPKPFEIDIAIQFHQNQVAMWIHENYQIEYTNSSVETAIRFYNCFMIKELKELRMYNPLQFLRSASIFQCYEIYTYFLTFIKKSKKAEEIRENLESSFNGASKSGCYRIINFLIENDLINHDINQIIYKPSKNSNPVILAAKHGNLKVLQVLIKFRNKDAINFNINCKTNLMMTPLHYAAQKKHFEVVKYLASLKDVNINDQSLIGWTPLHFAVDQEDQEIVRFLCSLNDKINIKIKDRFGDTASDLAKKNHLFVIERIINMG